MEAVRLIERASRAGYRLTSAGKQSLRSSSLDLAEIERALGQGVHFDQIATAEWDGDLIFEAATDPDGES